MRKLVLFLCSLCAAAIASFASAAEPTAGTLSVERGKGVVMIDLRGIVLGRLATGIAARDRPDAERPLRRARRRAEADAGAARAAHRALPGPGPALPHARRRLSDGRARIGDLASRRWDAASSCSTAIRRFPGDDAGVYSLDGVDCSTRARALHAAADRAGAVRARAAAEPSAEAEDRAVTTPHTILVVEDETSIASFVAAYLRNAGYVVKTAATAQAALIQLAGDSPALVILDLNLPDGDGVELCRRIRKTSDVPILMLTARDEDIDKIIGLEVGADDYMTKPFNPRELVARVKSILRRAAPERRTSESDELQHGDLTINAGKREVHVGDEEIRLAPKEFDLLWELLDHRGIVLTRDQLLERVWGYTFAGDTRTVDVHVRQIRRKLGDASPIVTVWGVGYKVASDRTAAPTI